MKTDHRTGLLGGTFNPVHTGHIELGKKVIDYFNLDRILYILSAIPPHKQGGNVLLPGLRWEMLKLSLNNFKNLIPCDIELKRENYSWTIDTVTSLKSIYPNDTLFFISGSEGFLKIKTWKSYRKLLNNLNFIVAVRKKTDEKEVTDLLRSENIRFTFEKTVKDQKPAVYIFSYDSPYISLSSTKIRERVKNGSSIEKLVSKSVKNFITEHDLYE